MSRFFAAAALLLLVCAIALHAINQQFHAENFGTAAFAALILALIMPERLIRRR